jgi:hypothetical protein
MPKRKVKVLLYLNAHHAMKTCMEGKLQLHDVLVSALNWGELGV